MLEDPLTPKQRQEMLTKLTDRMVSIEGENMRPVRAVVLGGTNSSDRGLGGTSLTTDGAKAPASGKSRS